MLGLMAIHALGGSRVGSAERVLLALLLCTLDLRTSTFDDRINHTAGWCRPLFIGALV
jgi:hypothetical protein